MPHEHQHRCLCEHDRVRFCRSCRTVYCEDCKQEWVTRPLMGYWPLYQQTLPSIVYSAGLTHQNQQIRDITPTITCHGGQT